jgi:hypothetical protein
MLPTDLQCLLDAIDACERDAHALVDGMSDEDVNWQPDRGRAWSVGQCLDHLRAINHYYPAKFIPLVQRAQAADQGPFSGMHPGVFARWFIRTQEPPPKQRMRAPGSVIPGSSFRAAEILDAYLASHEPYRALVRTSATIDVDRVIAPNPFFKLIKMRLATVLQIIPAHDRRHLWQARQVKEKLATKNTKGS